MQAAFSLGLGLGLASAFHCVAMCGPLVAFVSIDPNGATDPWRVARYQLGRMAGYGALGAAAGSFGGGLVQLVPASAEAMLSIVLALALALAALQLWPRDARPTALVAIGRERSSPTIVERASRIVGRLLARVRRVPLLLGVLSAALPCGVLASGVLLAASTGDAVSGLAAMSGLALTSGLGAAALGVGVGRIRLVASIPVARTMAITLAVGALVLLSRPMWVAPEGPRCHEVR